MTSSCYCSFQCLWESRSFVQHSQFGKTPHQVYEAISKLILGQLLFGNISLSLYPALPLLSVLPRVHLHIEPKHPNIVWYVLWKQGFLVLDFSERIVRFWGHKKQDEFCINRLTLNFRCFFNFFYFFAALWLISELHGFILHILNSNFWQYFICILSKLLGDLMTVSTWE